MKKNNINKINSASESFEQRLKRIRKKAGLTQNEIAAELSIDCKSYGKYEQGRTRPSFESLVIIAKTFNVSIDYLLCGTTKSVLNKEVSKCISMCPENKRKYLLTIIDAYIKSVTMN